MEYTPLINLTDSNIKIFGTMDGFSIAKWVLKVENPFDDDVCCRLSFDFLDKRGVAIGASDQWKWFFDVYSKKQLEHINRGCLYLIRGNSIREISGLVKTTAQEAARFADIQYRIDNVTIEDIARLRSHLG